MVKIVSRKSLGKQPVYDLGVAKDHNFLLANGTVASNCFNKSHSTAYAYVTYQTAYLKANYPVEYMAALLTASSGIQDKVDKYRENCQKMGIVVEPPDINRSEADFLPLSDKSLLFGLSAVKNLGQGAIENILKSREEGEFKSLANFCDRVELNKVNRRALETLIYCGAFDRIDSNRRQLIQDLDVVIAWAQKRTKERDSGQMNLFDMLGDNLTGDRTDRSFEQAPSTPAVEDFPLQEKLRLEKEHIGFYLSDHPLKSAYQAAQILSPIQLNNLTEQNSRQKVSAVVMLNAVKTITTKKGDPMAFLQMEDITGEAEGTVFPSTYEKLAPILQENNRLIVWGKVQKREERYQIIIDDAEPIEKVKMILFEITPEQASDKSKQVYLKQILQESQDTSKLKIPVVAVIGKGKNRQFVRFGQKFWIHDESQTINNLQKLGFRVYSQPLLSS
ncbi:OB-fold nucleic acid binding domain-containing protein [Myxosarcina sp. GI1]|uniref:helix-hairpin-helix domain-containing protein n=1 Tax=Myxosarcina sp. GI1 TaxID=1541065 RepID=UPI000562BD8D